LWRLCTEPHCGPLQEKALCSQCGEHCRLRRTRMEWLDLKCRRFPQGGKVRLNRTNETNHAPPWERAVSAAQNTLTSGCLFPPWPFGPLVLWSFGPLVLWSFAAAPPLWCNPRLGAAGATRSQGDAKGSMRSKYKHLASQSLAPSEAIISSYLWRFGAGN
jgi:hypothetical protein